ncbi:DUF2617 family protein [Rhodococcus chondri]|uniref:DUF2617 family protein n=1 Tax=Rhodococcus chondri TaxID=3065941 RepID=A0ABU7JQQ8_9NOCA|nr:DUF2617 family protein [Rhodococcus sp. CC-R104]MEE2032092.1 DUF2617 family protein [Rhodococcus sp. CC-R104]
MSVHLLEVAPRDVSADELGLVLGAPAPAALVSMRLTDPDAGELVLGVLAASHVVTATSGRRHLTEQVSCDAIGIGGRRLPELEHGDGYRFSSRTVTVSRAALARRAGELREAAAVRTWLCAGFPGDPDALTALTADASEGEWHWRTWHLYPRSDAGVIVETESRWRP